MSFHLNFEVFLAEIREKLDLQNLENKMKKQYFEEKKRFQSSKKASLTINNVRGRKTFQREPGVLFRFILTPFNRHKIN